jgi:NAD/NADP transhydrogenase beta subunit
MNCLRAFFLRHRGMALAVIALVLAMKALVPTGYMIGSDARVLTVQVCDGFADGAKSVAIAVKGHGDAGKATHDQTACPYAGMTHAGLTGADAIQLADALAFILLLGFVAAGFTVPRPLVRLRPPLRAPPALA